MLLNQWIIQNIVEFSNNPSTVLVSRSFHEAYQRKIEYCKSMLEKFIHASRIKASVYYTLFPQFEQVWFCGTEFHNIDFFNRLKRGHNAMVFYKNAFHYVAVIDLYPKHSPHQNAKVYFYQYSTLSFRSREERVKVFPIDSVLKLQYYSNLYFQTRFTSTESQKILCRS